VHINKLYDVVENLFVLIGCDGNELRFSEYESFERTVRQTNKAISLNDV
jgi:hypothetical protein